MLRLFRLVHHLEILIGLTMPISFAGHDLLDFPLMYAIIVFQFFLKADVRLNTPRECYKLLHNSIQLNVENHR